MCVGHASRKVTNLKVRHDKKKEVMLVRFAGFMGSGLRPFAMLPDLFTYIASITLLYLTR